MLRRPLCFAATALTTLTLLANCGSSEKPDGDGEAGEGGSAGSAGSSAGTSPKAGTGPGAGSGGSGVSGSGGSGTPTAGSGGKGTAGGSSGSTSAGTGGTLPGAGGSNLGGGGSGTSGTNPGGAAGTTGGGGSGPDVDQNGKMNATPGTMTSTNQDYLRLGEVRILNNNWGSAELGCGDASTMSIFVNQDRSFGWTFNRGNCDTANSNAKPDFPQIEFGIHPFGIGDPRVTSPEFSSTTLLPIQIKNVQSMTVNVQNLQANFQQESSWNITFEFWISQGNPLEPNPGVYAELMTFWGWQSGRWPSPPNGEGPIGNGAGNQVQSGGKSYTLWVQDDAWADGQWRYFQFRADDGPQRSFNGTLDVKPFIDYLVTSRNYSPEFWISRLEVGSEIDDNTQGTVQMSGITFEVNGMSRPAIIGGN